jgi:hypothetical protein
VRRLDVTAVCAGAATCRPARGGVILQHLEPADV